METVSCPKGHIVIYILKELLKKCFLTERSLIDPQNWLRDRGRFVMVEFATQRQKLPNTIITKVQVAENRNLYLNTKVWRFYSTRYCLNEYRVRYVNSLTF